MNPLGKEKIEMLLAYNYEIAEKECDVELFRFLQESKIEPIKAQGYGHFYVIFEIEDNADFTILLLQLKRMFSVCDNRLLQTIASNIDIYRFSLIDVSSVEICNKTILGDFPEVKHLSNKSVEEMLKKEIKEGSS